jgi:hypothetical protein
MKQILGLHSKASNHGTRGELGNFPVLLEQIVLSVRYLVRLSSMPEESMAKKSFMENKRLMHSDSTCWLKNLHNVFIHCNENVTWNRIMNGEHVNRKDVGLYISGKLKEMYKNQWIKAINIEYPNGRDGNKLRTYSKFKKEFKIENYIMICKNKSERSAFCKLRISAHRLMFETGRHYRPKLAPGNRFCPSCNDGSIEDEKHFLLTCKLYESKRAAFLNDLQTILPDIFLLEEDKLFIVILNCYHGDTEISSIVASYVKQCMDIRDVKD